MSNYIDQLELRITDWTRKHGIFLLRLSIGLIFFLFGAFKLFNGMSPAEGLVYALVDKMSDAIAPDLFFPALGIAEVLIGLGLLFEYRMRAVLILLAMQMAGTFLPLVMLPEICFQTDPLGLTLEGQYILKNLILISGAVVIGSTIAPRHQASSTESDERAEALVDERIRYRYPEVLTQKEHTERVPA